MAVRIDLMGDVHRNGGSGGSAESMSGMISTETPSSLSSFLTNNARDTNQNRKFSTSSPTASILNRLGYNFDPADDNILELSPEVLEQLRRMPRLFKDWQAEDLRSGNVGSYYKNPAADNVLSINGVLEEIKSKILVNPGGTTFTRLS